MKDIQHIQSRNAPTPTRRVLLVPWNYRIRTSHLLLYNLTSLRAAIRRLYQLAAEGRDSNPKPFLLDLMVEIDVGVGGEGTRPNEQ